MDQDALDLHYYIVHSVRHPVINSNDAFNKNKSKNTSTYTFTLDSTFINVK